MRLLPYGKIIFWPEGNSRFEPVNCIARLNQDISVALPYVNAEPGGTQYGKESPGVIFHVSGKMIKVSGDNKSQLTP